MTKQEFLIRFKNLLQALKQMRPANKANAGDKSA